jgi:hypothetical protein
LPPNGDGDRCQNCARQQRECVVQPIAGSTRKGGRNQANAISTEPMPYAEALSMTRQNNSIAHRRAQKPDRFVEGFYNQSIAIPPPYFSNQQVNMPLSAPGHFPSVPFLSASHPEQSGYSPDSARRPPFKQMQSAPGTMYTLHHGSHDAYPGQFPSHPHYNIPQDTFHPPGEDTSNAFWKLSVTSPSVSDAPLPPPRQNQWGPNANSNYTHERPNSSVTLPAPHNAFSESQTLQNPNQYFTPAMAAPVNFQPSPQGSTHSSQPHEEHCESSGPWSRPATAAVRNGN